MQKMLIKLDEAKIKRLKRYELSELWQNIDEIFVSNHCKVKIEQDGSHLYITDIRRPEQQFADLGLSVIALVESEWFPASVGKWIWYESEDLVSDVLEDELREDPDFRKAYNV